MRFITTFAMNLNRGNLPPNQLLVGSCLRIALNQQKGRALLVLAVVLGLGFPAAATAFSPASSVLAAASPQTTQISIVNGAGTSQSSLGFSPDAVTVVIGVNNTVTWTNNDNTMDAGGYLPDHILATTSDGFASPLFTSPAMNPGDTFTFTFTTAGTVAYHCNVHPWMKGTVIVKGAGTTPAPEFPLPYLVMILALGACAIAFRLTRDGSASLFGARSA